MGKYFFYFLLLICQSVSYYAKAQVKDYHRNLLTTACTKENLDKFISNSSEIVVYPSYRDRALWGKLSQEVVKKHTSDGDVSIKYTWDNLTPTLYAQFKTTGNRTNFEAKYFAKRDNLNKLFQAELVTGRGKYLKAINNGVESILSEEKWNIPAHEKIEVDLYVSETAILLAWIDYLLGKELEDINPGIRVRLKDSVRKRFLNQVLEKDFSWMGNQPNQKLNNWTPWIISNWIPCSFFLCDNKDQKVEHIYKAMKCLDNFINRYPSDGGCDEGPGYWVRNGGALFTSLDWLSKLSNGSINLYSNTVIKGIGAYIYKVYISGSYFVNFGDTHPKPNPNVDIMFRFGESLKDTTLVKFAAYLAKNRKYSGYGGGLSGIFSYDLATAVKGSPPLLKSAWLEDIQVFSARSTAGSSAGLYLAGKAGSNGENHNHNDVGNFIIYSDGQPFIIDIGVEAYSSATFSPSKRYSIWTMRSQYHTLPTINGVEQSVGKKYAADKVSFQDSGREVRFTEDIANAYPPQAKVKSWRRSIKFERGGSIKVEESYELAERTGQTFLTFMTPCEIQHNGKGNLKLTSEQGSSLILNYDPAKVTVESDVKEVTDSRLKKFWGEKINRIKLVVKSQNPKDTLSYSFSKI